MEVAAKLMWLWALVSCISTTMDSAGLLAGFGLGCLLQALLRSAFASVEGTTSLLGPRASRTTRLVLMTMTSLLAACLSFISERAIYGGVWLIPIYGSLLLGVIEGALLSVLISWAIVDLPGAGADFPTLRHIFRAELPKMAPVGTLSVLNLLVAILAGRSVLVMVTALEVIALSTLLGKTKSGERNALSTGPRLKDLYPSAPGFQVALFALATLCIVGTRLNLVGGWSVQGFLSACALGIIFQIVRLEGSRRGLRLALFGFALGALSLIGTPRPGKGLGYLGILALLLFLVVAGACLYGLRARVLERTNNLFNVEETVVQLPQGQRLWRGPSRSRATDPSGPQCKYHFRSS